VAALPLSRAVVGLALRTGASVLLSAGTAASVCASGGPLALACAVVAGAITGWVSTWR